MFLGQSLLQFLFALLVTASLVLTCLVDECHSIMKPSKDVVSLDLNEIGTPPDIFVATQGLDAVFKGNV